MHYGLVGSAAYLEFPLFQRPVGPVGGALDPREGYGQDALGRHVLVGPGLMVLRLHLPAVQPDVAPRLGALVLPQPQELEDDLPVHGVLEVEVVGPVGVVGVEVPVAAAVLEEAAPRQAHVSQACVGHHALIVRTTAEAANMRRNRMEDFAMHQCMAVKAMVAFYVRLSRHFTEHIKQRAPKSLQTHAPK
eukprot:scaffold303578_cov37-Prasinocladus_malaysianus.AAC.1